MKTMWMKVLGLVSILLALTGCGGSTDEAGLRALQERNQELIDFQPASGIIIDTAEWAGGVDTLGANLLLAHGNEYQLAPGAEPEALENEMLAAVEAAGYNEIRPEEDRPSWCARGDGLQDDVRVAYLSNGILFMDIGPTACGSVFHQD